MEIRRLESLDELFTASGGDFLLRNEVPELGVAGGGGGSAAAAGRARDGAAWITEDGTFAFGGPEHHGDWWVTVIGDPASATTLLGRVMSDLDRPLLGASAPRGTDLEGLGLGGFTHWDFMVFGGGPGNLATVPGFGDVEEIPADGKADDELEEFLKEANPTASARPGWERIRVWGAVRDADGAIIAAGALCRPPGGHGHLASIGTRPSARGRGLGAAVTAWLTARALSEGDAFCGLGHWVPNEPARRVYLRLGYRTTHAMCSGRFD